MDHVLLSRLSNAGAFVHHTQDQELAARVLAREAGAFDEFFQTYFDRVYRFCVMRMPQDAVEDVVQEVLLRALRKMHQYRGEASLHSWLCMIARNQMSDWFKQHRPERSPQLGLDDDPQVAATLASMANQAAQDDQAQRELSNAVQLALDYLPDRYGRALEWKYLEGCSVAEIAQRMDLGSMAVQSMLARARTAFRAAFVELQQELDGRDGSGWIKAEHD